MNNQINMASSNICVLQLKACVHLCSREGQVKEAFWGQLNYRLSYDSKKRLRTVELGSTIDTLAFDYQSKSFPYLVSQFFYQYE